MRLLLEIFTFEKRIHETQKGATAEDQRLTRDDNSQFRGERQAVFSLKKTKQWRAFIRRTKMHLRERPATVFNDGIRGTQRRGIKRYRGKERMRERKRATRDEERDTRQVESSGIGSGETPCLSSTYASAHGASFLLFDVVFSLSCTVRLFVAQNPQRIPETERSRCRICYASFVILSITSVKNLYVGY